MQAVTEHVTVVVLALFLKRRWGEDRACAGRTGTTAPRFDFQHLNPHPAWCEEMADGTTSVLSTAEARRWAHPAPSVSMNIQAL